MSARSESGVATPNVSDAAARSENAQSEQRASSVKLNAVRVPRNHSISRLRRVLKSVNRNDVHGGYCADWPCVSVLLLSYASLS